MMHGARKIAVVGAGPSGLYATAELLRRDGGVNVALFDRLPVIGGLARFGVSPDHAQRRRMIAVYDRLAVASGRFDFHGHVDIGGALTHDMLRRHHDAVIYAAGASSDRQLGIAGETLPGSHAATEFVGWYNAHPDHAHRQYRFDHERAVVVGNGNVALDIARMLLLDPRTLRKTDIADHALQALAGSRIREVVVLGRRGPAQAAFTAPELLELCEQDEFDVIVEGVEAPPAAMHGDALRLQLLDELRRRPARHEKRLRLRFQASPTEILGDGAVNAVRIGDNELVLRDGVVVAQATTRSEIIEAGLVLRSIGYRGVPMPGLPFDAAAGVIPNRDGRVIGDDAAPLAGVYVTGWLKRGPRGVIGTNKQCANQTVRAVLDDLHGGALPVCAADPDDFALLLQRHAPERVDHAGWRRIDDHERQLGAAAGRPRIKLAGMNALLAAAAAPAVRAA